MYELRYSNAAKKYFKKIKEKGLQVAFKEALCEISNNPQIGTMKTGDLTGIYAYDVFYNRTNYEIAYYIYEKDNTVVVIIMAGTRENFYEELKRYMQ